MLQPRDVVPLRCNTQLTNPQSSRSNDAYARTIAWQQRDRLRSCLQHHTAAELCRITLTLMFGVSTMMALPNALRSLSFSASCRRQDRSVMVVVRVRHARRLTAQAHQGTGNARRTPSLSPPAPLGRAFWPVPDACGTVTCPSMTDLMYSALSRYSLNCTAHTHVKP